MRSPRYDPAVRIAALVVLAACTSHDDAGLEPEPVDDHTLAMPRPVRDYEVRWSNVAEQHASCFYFSGPKGRDDLLIGRAVLTRTGDRVRLEIGNAAFVGALFAQGEVRLRRTSTHDFGGDWVVDETIVGRYTDGVLVAHYVYDECEQRRRCEHDCIVTGIMTVSR